MSRPVRVLIVDDHAIVREGLKRILDAAGDFVIAGEAANVPDALHLIRNEEFDVAVIDISLPDRTGLELLRLAKVDRPRLPVLVLSAYAEDHYAVRALRDGADGYLNKEGAPELLVTALRKVASGGKYVSAALAERIAVEIGSSTGRPAHELLSDRELEIMRLVVAGHSLKLIAEQLHISPKTVTTYRTRIIEKTGLHSNAEMARYAIENRLFE